MMSSGVRWNEDYSDPGSDLAKYYAKSAHEEALISYLSGLPRAHPPGSLFHYNTAETHLAGLVISRAAGSTLSDYLSEKIWKPYGMERDAYWATDPQGRELAGCCLYMTLADYARVGQFALDDGVIGGKAVTAPGWIAESTRVQIANDQPAPAGYGYFWWIGAHAFEASGIFGQSILVYPKERLVIVVNSAWPKPVGKEFFAALSQFQGAVRDAAASGAPKLMKP
jgi:CubicO group peptidase (beta-lactamase class C family)